MTNYIGNKPSDVPLTASDIPDLPTSKITSGTFADARLSASSVTQHAQSVDLQPVKSDITALALREATNESSASFNLPNQHIDTFATDTLGTKTNVGITSGYATPQTTGTVNPTVSAITVSGGANNSPTFSINNSTGLITHDHTSTTSDYDDNDIYGCRLDLGENRTITSDLYVQIVTIHNVSGNGNMGITELNASTGAGSGYFFGSGGYTPSTYDNAHGGSWANMGSGASAYYDQAFNYNGKYMSDGDLPGIIRLRWTENSGTISARYIDVGFANTQARPKTFNLIHNATSTSTTPGGTNLGLSYSGNILNATGTAIQNTNTVGSSKTEVGGTMLFKENAGSTTLGTDLKVYFTCNGGTNWTEASSYNAITPVYSTGIKQVRLGKTTCTAGTDVRYKVEWYNQSAGSKETQLHGIGINY